MTLNQVALINVGFLYLITALILYIASDLENLINRLYLIGALIFSAYLGMLVIDMTRPDLSLNLLLTLSYCLAMTLYLSATVLANQHINLTWLFLCLATVSMGVEMFVDSKYSKLFDVYTFLLLFISILFAQRQKNMGDWIFVISVSFSLVLLISGLLIDYNELSWGEAFITFSQHFSSLTFNAGILVSLIMGYWEKTQYLVNHDPLTKTANRTKLNQFVASFEKICLPYTIQLINLRGVAQVNEKQGYSQGDMAIMRFARILRNHSSSTTLVVRLGGNEFCIVCPDYTHCPCQPDKIIKEVENDPTLKSISGHFKLSIASASYPEYGQNLSAVLNAAEIALSAARQNKFSSVVVLTPEAVSNQKARIELAQKLEIAINQQHLEVFYQPKMDVQHNQLVGAEALIRWKVKEQYIPTDELISIAEDFDLITQIDRFVITQAWNLAERLNNNGVKLKISANFSSAAIANGYEAFPLIKTLVEEQQLTPELFELEVTESAFSDHQRAIADFKKITAIGISIAMDDFGTGYSNLGALCHLPINTLKIDRSFINEIHQDPIVTQTILNLGRKLKLTLVAEGVETDAQLQWLKHYQCDYIQGYLFSKPLNEAEFVEFVKQNQ